jgi:hypothetical protein
MEPACSVAPACESVVMNERHQISLSEISPQHPSELLDKIKDAINELLDCSVSGASGYVKGKGEQELAKAREIRAKVLSCLGNLDLERQRLIAERDKLIYEDKQKMYELKTQRLESVVNSLIKLKEIGVVVESEVVINQLIKSMND